MALSNGQDAHPSQLRPQCARCPPLSHDAHESRNSQARSATYSLQCINMHSNLSSVGTLTPASAMGRASFASAVDTWSPHSEVSEQLGGGSSKASVQNSSTGNLEFCAIPPDRGYQVRAFAGEFRRNKYREPIRSYHRSSPQGQSDAAVLQAIVPCTASASSCASTSRHGGDLDSGDANEVLIQGCLQQRTFLFFWRERWCVLDIHGQLTLFRDEEEYVLQPESPLERHDIDMLRLRLDLQLPSVIHCADANTGDPVMCLRAGPGSQWEEVAATSLWLFACLKASREKPRAGTPCAVPSL